MALSDDLVAWWKLDGDGVDATGRGNDLTNNGASWVTGLIGSAADLESSESDNLSRADNADLSMGDIGVTVCAWVKMESKPTAAGEMDIVSKFETVGNQREYRLEYWGPDVDSGNGDKFAFGVSGDGASVVSGNYARSTTFGAASTGVWYFVVAQHDPNADTIGIGVNAGSMDTKAWSTGIFNGTSVFRLGALGRAAPTFYFDGLIDMVGIWKRVLSGAEITQLYNGGAGIDYPFASGIVPIILSNHGAYLGAGVA